MPDKLGYMVSANIPWSACPNSWKSVVTSLKVNKDGFVDVGLVKLHTIDTCGLSFLSFLSDSKITAQAFICLFLHEIQNHEAIM